MICARALPSRFRRTRVALVGFGDIAQRILTQRSALWRSSPQAPRLLAIGRKTGWDLDVQATARRLARCTQNWIVLVPPSEREAGTTQDHRSLALAQALRHSHGARRTGPVTRLVYVSTTGVYGDHAGRYVSETDPLNTTQPRSLRRVDAEQTWRALSAHLLRVPGITAEDRLPIERIRRASPALRPQDDVFTSHIHADDLARLAWAALWRGLPRRVTNTVMQGHLKMADYFDLVADAFGLARCPRLSRAEFEQAVRVGELSAMQASFMQDSRRVVGKRLSELRVPLRFRCIEDVIQSARNTPR